MLWYGLGNSMCWIESVIQTLNIILRQLPAFITKNGKKIKCAFWKLEIIELEFCSNFYNWTKFLSIRKKWFLHFPQSFFCANFAHTINLFDFESKIIAYSITIHLKIYKTRLPLYRGSRKIFLWKNISVNFEF